MNRRTLFAAVAMLSCTATTDALAQRSGPTPGATAAAASRSQDRIGNRDNMIGLRRRNDMEQLFKQGDSAARVYDASKQMARCIVKLSGDRASGLFGGPGTDDPSYSNINRALTSGRYGGCVRGGDLSGLSRSLLSSAIAEELVIRGDKMLTDDRAAQVDATRAAAFHGALGGVADIATISRCAVVYSPGLASKVLKTESGSAEEATALEALYAQTPECGVPRTPTEIDRTLQRAALAEGLYAWTHLKN